LTRIKEHDDGALNLALDLIGAALLNPAWRHRPPCRTACLNALVVLDLDQSYSADDVQNTNTIYFATQSSCSVNEKKNMNLHTPSVPLFVTSLVFAALALVGHFVLIPFITLYGFWVAIIAYVILALGIVMKT
jgi:hypothetical protein